MSTSQLKPFLSIDCTDCQANAHQFAQEPELHVKGFCGLLKTRGGCFGVINYPIRNPSEACHNSFSQSVKFNAEKA